LDPAGSVPMFFSSRFADPRPAVYVSSHPLEVPRVQKVSMSGRRIRANRRAAAAQIGMKDLGWVPRAFEGFLDPAREGGGERKLSYGVPGIPNSKESLHPAVEAGRLVRLIEEVKI
jgi:hypothetical protein